jgi:hypothetical protein
VGREKVAVPGTKHDGSQVEGPVMKKLRIESYTGVDQKGVTSMSLPQWIPGKKAISQRTGTFISQPRSRAYFLLWKRICRIHKSLTLK